MNAVLQSFMHQPIFLNWIQTHNHTIRRGRGNQTLYPCHPTPPAYMIGTGGAVRDCTACALKDLVNVYWDNTPAVTPVPHGGPEMRRIINIAVASGLFHRGQLMIPVNFTI